MSMQFGMMQLPSRDEARPSVFAEARRALAGDPLRRAIVGYLMLLVVALPLPFGGWRDWAIDCLAICTALMLLGVAWNAARGTTQGLERLSLVAVPTALYALVLIWACLQASSLEIMRPLWNPLWAQASAALAEPLAASVSLDRFETMRGLVSLASYLGVFLLAIYAISDLRVSRMLVRLFVYAAAAYAVYGLIVYFTGSAVVLWFDKEQYLNVVTATFDNRNNFATYCGMALIAGMGLFLNEVSRRRQMPTKQSAIVLVDRIWRMTWPLVVAMAILATALLLTASRAGAVTTLIGLGALCGTLFLTTRLRPFRPRGLLIAGIVLVVLLVILSGDRTTERIFIGLDAEEERFKVYVDALKAVRDFAFAGTGLGSFEDAYRFYRSIELRNHFVQAHNDVLEAAMELGVPAATGLLVSILLLVGNCWRELRARRRGAVFPCIAVAVSLQVGLHSLLDFSMQVPAVVIAYALILACGLTRADRPVGEKGPA
ncbi:MAG TPA: O-antigen ligase family protein [Alphaproteobacteria bacterium]|jgi:hypothetical protein